MNKVILWRMALLLYASFTAIGARAQVFDRTIYLSSGADQQVKEAAEDMAYWLSKSAGVSFQVKTERPPRVHGITVSITEGETLTANEKKQLSVDGQSFILDVNGVRAARIIGTGSTSIINGIYTFLHELGFRWYMPGDAWTIVPDVQAFDKRIRKVYTPSFRNRSYFGTGGNRPLPGIDPQGIFYQDFLTWNRRNRWSVDITPTGHVGQAFYLENRKLLDGRPELFCGGKVNNAGRIDISNQQAVTLFADWAIRKSAAALGRFKVIAVDPADGSGGADDCLPAKMPQIKTWSDKYFWLANKVAEEAVRQKAEAPVQLYAYASHAAPPQFNLHPLVSPVIIPYAFQNVADPADFVKLWNRKLNGRPMGMYDYWNITQWSKGVPQFNIYSIPGKLSFWKQHNVTTVHLESTNGKGAMGHALWLAAQLLWDVDQSFESLYQEFLDRCFGAASGPVRRMYDRWSRNYQGGLDVGLSMRDLQEAEAKAKDPSIKARIDELKAYVNYLKLYYDYQADASLANYENLVNYLREIHPLTLVQTSALLDYYIPAPGGYTKKEAASAQVLTPDAVRQQAARKFATFEKKAPATYRISSLHFDIAKTGSVPVKTQPVLVKYLNGRNTYTFFIARKQTLTWKVGATADTRLQIKDPSGKQLLDRNIKASKDSMEKITLTLNAGYYVFSYGAYARFSRIEFPDGVVFLSSDHFYDNYGYPVLHVYIPKDVSEVVYYDQNGPGTNGRGYWIDPAGKRVDAQPMQYGNYRVPVAPEYRGKTWRINMGHRGFRLLNIPDLYSLSDFFYQE